MLLGCFKITMEIINFEKDRIENIEIEDGSVTLYFLNGDTKGKTYPYSALSVSEKLFIVKFFENKISQEYGQGGIS